MIRRITSALLIGGAGLFQSEATGRLIFKNIEGDITWTSHLDCPDPLSKEDNSSITDNIYDWCMAICNNNLIRRSIDDAHLALTYPHEALVFVYRGLEWIKEGLKLEWEDIAKDMGVPYKDIKNLKKFANRDTGIRHATETGKKARGNAEAYSHWVCGLFDAVNAARSRIDSSFKPMTSEEIANAIMKASPLVPYP
jgi:hypothetical protein